ncbi:hypothetical protein VB776_17860 [Arcicella sp. DC2W]|uniref:Uncharacterized protein n=1 Tax=Arcicella gelida TaxID=2984195 RepID=A0ABU5S8R7_9BACT|nr:hypothetical protein [Arcicella sp. DC2W]MEA5404805.1 hypothetical protein [Arcicella sp. DC2W]
MKIPIRLISAFSIFTILSANAQDNNFDALAKLFGQTAPTGSARFQALGGNHAALGADIGSAAGNPAGLGFYTRSEFNFTPAFQNTSNNSNYIGTNTKASESNFNIANIGVVFGGSQPQYKEGWRGSWSINYSRQNTFYNNIQFGGRNTISSIADAFAQQVSREAGDYNLGVGDFVDAVGQTPNFDLTRNLYYWSFLISPDQNNPQNFKATEQSFVSDQKYSFESTGRSSQWTIAYGGTPNEKTYIGFSLGIPSFRYETRSQYSEQYVNNTAFNGLTQSKFYSTSGSGINLTFGAIIKPNEMIRFGASITTPTWYDIDETLSSGLKADVNSANAGKTGLGIVLPNGTDNETVGIINRLKSSGYGILEKDGSRYLTNVPLLTTTPFSDNYQLRTPLKANIGMAIFFAKKGFISADIEYLAYTSTKMSTTTNDPYLADDLDYYTQKLRRDLKNVFNLKVGAEYRIMSMVSLRAGVNYQPSPYSFNFDQGSNAINRSTLIFSTGLGFRTSDFYVDFTGLYAKTTQAFNPYVLSNTDSFSSAIIDNSYLKGVVSFGIFF